MNYQFDETRVNRNQDNKVQVLDPNMRSMYNVRVQGMFEVDSIV